MGIVAGQPAIVVAKDIVAFRLGERLDEIAPGFGKDVADAVQKPVHFAGPAEEYSTQHQPEAPLGMRLGIGQCQRAAPRPAEQEEPVDFQMFAQGLYIVDQMRGGVVGEFAARRGPACAALIENDDPVAARIEEPAMDGGRAGARSSMQEQYRQTPRIT